jgi:hypothetical protein
MQMAMDFLQTTMPAGGLLAHTVYHGSPHKFNKFDMSKIGTGEGAQAYGHGLYFAESPGVDKSYIEANGTPSYIVDGVDVGTHTPTAYAAKLLSTTGTPPRQAVNNSRSLLSKINKLTPEKEQYFKDTLAEIDRLEQLAPKIEKGGAFYKVDIPDEAIPRMLDWDKKLSEQGDTWKLLQEKFPYLGNQGHKTGEWALGEIGEGMGGLGPRLTQEMQQAGIPGIRYLDQGSRATTGGELIDLMKSPEGYRAKIRVTNRTGVGFQSPTDMFTTSGPFKTAEEAQQWANSKINQGTSNFVLFDDQLPRILEINGQPTGLLSYADEAKKVKKVKK